MDDLIFQSSNVTRSNSLLFPFSLHRVGHDLHITIMMSFCHVDRVNVTHEQEHVAQYVVHFWLVVQSVFSQDTETKWLLMPLSLV